MSAASLEECDAGHWIIFWVDEWVRRTSLGGWSRFGRNQSQATGVARWDETTKDELPSCLEALGRCHGPQRNHSVSVLAL